MDSDTLLLSRLWTETQAALFLAALARNFEPRFPPKEFVAENAHAYYTHPLERRSNSIPASALLAYPGRCT